MSVRKMSNLGLASTSVAYKSFLAGNLTYVPFTPTGSFESIATYTVGAGGSSNISFTSIPQTYTHLQIRWVCRISAPTTDENLQLQVGNSSIDSGSNYSLHYVFANGSSVSAGYTANSTGANLGRLTGSSATTGIFGVGVIDILDYTSTKYKTFRGLSGHDENGSGTEWVASGSWRNTSAIDTIQLNQLYGSGNFIQYSSFALYGVK